MICRVQYFAVLREAAGRDFEDCDTTATTPRELYAELREQHAFAFGAEQLRVAVNGVFADWDRALVDGDEVVFVPPVSGG